MTRGARPWVSRASLLLLGALASVALAEIVLWAADRPRVHTPRSRPPQFGFLSDRGDGVLYLNAPSRVIRFHYDGNPRGYFGEENEVDHAVNALGFRGPELDARWSEDGALSIAKPAGSTRILFLGDSFTFGEGVWLRDTFAERTAALLRERGVDAHAVNMGVGGYNTEQSLRLLEAFGLAADPDLVVLGYVPNDAEPPLFRVDPETGERVRRSREAEELAAAEVLPEGGVYTLRSARLLWQLHRNRVRSAQTLDYYRGLYDESRPGWRASREALRALDRICRERGIPCLVLLFPLLTGLDDYPLSDVHAMLGELLADLSLVPVDLLPRLAGMRGEELWVHPTDQHPNERVHAIAAQAIADEILERGLLGR